MQMNRVQYKRKLVFFLVLLQLTLVVYFGRSLVAKTLKPHANESTYSKIHRNHSETRIKIEKGVIAAEVSDTVAKAKPRPANQNEAIMVHKTRSEKHHVTEAQPDAHQQEARGSESAKIFNKVYNNSVFINFTFPERLNRSEVNLLLVVSSAPKRIGRRKAIRETWWQLCKSSHKVRIKCLFITDKQGKDSKYAQPIKEELEKYHDLEFQNLGGGVEFGKRYLYHILWAVRNFEFDYFLRLDDDYFICLDKIINELPMPPVNMFHWGWVHCINSITRPEESVLLLSKDVIELFLLQNPDTMRCHPWADQQLGLWVEDLNLKQKLHYRHDLRLEHDQPNQLTLTEKDICKGRIGLHGSYPEAMHKFWKNRGTYELKKETLLENSQICQSDLKFDWNEFDEFWRYEPKLCKNDPKWNTTKQGDGQSYGGREEGFG